MSTTQPAAPSLDLDSVTYPQIREALDPFDAGWMPYFRVLTSMYMQRESRPWATPGPHHAYWFENLFASGDDVILLAHRGSLKTTATLSYIVGNLEYRDGYHAAWIGNNQELAYEKAHSEFNTVVERNAWLTNLQESGRREDQKGKKTFQNNSTLSVGWLFGGIEGRHVDLLVVDDLIKEKGDGNTGDIERWLSSVIVPIQEHGGQTIVIGTRKRDDDIYATLAEREGYRFVEFPAVLDHWDAEFGAGHAHRPPADLYHEAVDPLAGDTARILWDERSTDYLDDALGKQSRRDYLREFCLVVEQPEGAIYDMFDAGRHVIDSAPPVSRRRQTAYGLDWGSGNPAGFIAATVGHDDTICILDEAKYPVDGTQDYVRELRDFERDWGAGRIHCDPSDKRGVDDLVDEGFDAVGAPNDVAAGIRLVQSLLAEGRLQIHERCEDLLAELGSYRWNSRGDKPVKRNDHLVDALRYLAAGLEWPDEDGGKLDSLPWR